MAIDSNTVVAVVAVVSNSKDKVVPDARIEVWPKTTVVERAAEVKTIEYFILFNRRSISLYCMIFFSFRNRL